MDDRHFDDWVRAVTTPSPRRGVLRFLAGALTAATLGGVLTARGAAAGAGCFKRKKRCRRDSQCCTLNCRYGVCR